MKDRTIELAKGQDHLPQFIDLERLDLDNFANLAHNELVFHTAGTTLLAGTVFNSGSTSCRKVRYFFHSGLLAEDKVEVDGHQLFLPKHLWKIVTDIHV